MPAKKSAHSGKKHTPELRGIPDYLLPDANYHMPQPDRSASVEMQEAHVPGTLDQPAYLDEEEQPRLFRAVPNSNMPPGGHEKGDWGDVGELRAQEAMKVGGFVKGSKHVVTKKYFSR